MRRVRVFDVIGTEFAVLVYVFTLDKVVFHISYGVHSLFAIWFNGDFSSVVFQVQGCCFVSAMTNNWIEVIGFSISRIVMIYEVADFVFLRVV